MLDWVVPVPAVLRRGEELGMEDDSTCGRVLPPHRGAQTSACRGEQVEAAVAMDGSTLFFRVGSGRLRLRAVLWRTQRRRSPPQTATLLGGVWVRRRQRTSWSLRENQTRLAQWPTPNIGDSYSGH